jgi:hypothetical protein
MPLHPARDDEGADVQLDRMLATARHMLDEEFKIAERVDQKARAQITAAGAFFAVVQAVAGAVLASSTVDDTLAAALVGLGIAAVLSTTVALVRTGNAARLFTEKALPLSKLRENYLPHAAQGNPMIGRHLVDYTLGLVDERRLVNDERAEAFENASTWCLLSVLFSAVEMILAFVIRIT